MKIITNAAVIYNGKKESPKDYYMSFVGDVTEFQTWANKNHNAGLVVDGIEGQFTDSAYAKWGAEWEAIQSKILADAKAKAGADAVMKDNAAKAIKDSADSVQANTGTSKTKDVEKTAETKVHTFMDTLAALSMAKKIIIGAGLLTVIGGIVWGLTTSGNSQTK